MDGIEEAIGTVGRWWKGYTDGLTGKDYVGINYLGIGPEDVPGPDSETAGDAGDGVA